jgi:hypothetical protein
MKGKEIVVVIAVALVLAFGFGGRKDEPPLPAEPAPAPTVVAPPAPPAVPLAVSETTPPPGWVNPADMTTEEQLAEWVRSVGRGAAWQLFGGVVVLAILAALVVSLEKGRYPQ